MDETRRAAWKTAIAKQGRDEEVLPEDHYALLREGMFAGEATPDVLEEAKLFLRYWIGTPDVEPLPWFGKIIANHWFRERDWDQQWNRSRADALLQRYIAADDFDHWTALNIIAARLHRAREPFPESLADWAAEVHEGKRGQPPKERGNEGNPPYSTEDRYAAFEAADHWLQHFGMKRRADRNDVIAQHFGFEPDAVSRGLSRWRRRGDKRRAPWPSRDPDAIQQ